MARRRRWRRNAAPDDRLISAVLGLGLALLFIVWMNAHLRPYLIACARADAQNRVTAAVTDVVAGRDGHDAATVTRAAVTALDALRSGEVRLPLGNLTGIPLLHGRGPGVRVRVLAVGVVQTAFTDEAYRLTVRLTLFLPWERIETEFLTEISK